MHTLETECPAHFVNVPCRRVYIHVNFLSRAKSGLINSPDDLMFFERADERVKLVHGQIPRPKLSPMRRLLGNNYAEASTQYFAASDQWALSGVWLSTRLDTRARQKVGPAGR